jgi:hypothetical protein
MPAIKALMALMAHNSPDGIGHGALPLAFSIGQTLFALFALFSHFFGDLTIAFCARQNT